MAQLKSGTTIGGNTAYHTGNLPSSSPVGMTYVQFPGRSTPASLFGGTWSAIFDNEGIFFRTPGGGATSFGGGIQQDQMQLVTGSLNSRGTESARPSNQYSSYSGAFSRGSTSSGRAYMRTSGNQTVINGVNFSTANSPDARVSSSTSGETRARNRTIRVWRKTAN